MQSDDGVASMAILEAADRLEEGEKWRGWWGYAMVQIREMGKEMADLKEKQENEAR